MKSAAFRYETLETNAHDIAPSRLERVFLLSILGYEGAGCLAGGGMLIAAPDGRYMDMPVNIMHGAFPNFLVPGIILFALGILNVLAFIAVLRRMHNQWLLVSLAIGGLLIWFLVEIFILGQLHWLHAMWGLPVVCGALLTLPLLPVGQEAVRKALLVCGVLSSLVYVVANVVTALLYKGYSPVSQTVSELSAFDTPTRSLWVWLVTLYALLVIAFGWGLWQSGVESRPLRIVGILFIADAIIGLFWPSMHRRDVLVAGGSTLSDTLHIVFTMVTVPLMMFIIAFGAAALGKRFRIYSIATLAVLIIAGIMTGIDGPKIAKNLPTPWVGVWERINIGVYMMWVVVFAVALLKKQKNEVHSMHAAVTMHRIV